MLTVIKFKGVLTLAQNYREVETTRTTEPLENTSTNEESLGNPKSEHKMTVAERIIYLLGGITLAILAIRFLLLLLGANPESGFADFMYTISRPLAAPFFGLFNYDVDYGRSTVEFASVVAFVIYGLLTMVVAKLATIGSHREDR